jgi:hypothetical protein
LWEAAIRRTTSPACPHLKSSPLPDDGLAELGEQVALLHHLSLIALN